MAETYVLLPRLRAVRHRKVLSQRLLGEKAGVHPRTIMAIEAGKPARYQSVRKLADALGVEPRELMGE